MRPLTQWLRRAHAVWMIVGAIVFIVAPDRIVHADVPASITLTASPSIILADGKSTTTISALATAEGGGNVPDGTVVRFTTTVGTLSGTSVSTSGGVAHVTLTSAGIPGEAVVSATFIAGSSAASSKVSVEFTSDKSIANTNQSEQDWIQVSSADYLSYSEDSRVAEAFAKKQGVHFSFRGLVIDADAMQIDLSANVVRARNATIIHDRNVILTADTLYYEYLNHSGTAILTDVPGQSTIETVRISGIVPTTEVVPVRQAPPGSTYEFVDLSADHVLVTASSLSFKPGQNIQLRRSTVYVDGKKVVGLPLEVLPINSNQIFGQQVLGYGTDGVFVDMPYYVDASSHTMDSFSVRSQIAERENGVTTSNNGTFSLDFEHSYKFANDTGSGAIDLVGIEQGAATGYRWHNTMLLGRDTHTYLDVEYPSRENLFTTANISHDFRGYSANLTNTYSHSIGDSSSTDSKGTTAYVSTTDRKLVGSNASGIRMTTNVTVNDTSVVEHYNGQVLTSNSETDAFGVRMFTPPQNFGRNSSLTDSYDLNGTYDQSQKQTAVTMDASLGFNQKLGPTTNSSLTYNWTHNPLNTSLQIVGGELILMKVPNLNRFGVSLASNTADSKFGTLLTGDIASPTGDYDASTSFNFHFNQSWRVGLSSLYNRTDGVWFRDFAALLGVRVGQREAQFSYSLVDHHIRFNLDATRF